MREYILKLCTLSVSSWFEDFKSMRSKFLWTVSCRPDVSRTIARLTQITEKDFDRNLDLKLTNRVLRHLQKHSIVLH